MKGTGPESYILSVKGGPIPDGRTLNVEDEVQYRPGTRYVIFGSQRRSSNGPFIYFLRNPRGVEEVYPYPVSEFFNTTMVVMIENGRGVLPTDEFTHSPASLRFRGPDQLIGKSEVEIEETIYSVLEKRNRL